MITSEQARHICDRNFGVGGDGVRDAASATFRVLCNLGFVLCCNMHQ